MTHTDNILEERRKQYGGFEHLSALSDNLRQVVENNLNWDYLDAHHREAIFMILHKIARIINGNPDHQDSWADTAGYAQLVGNITAKQSEV